LRVVVPVQTNDIHAKTVRRALHAKGHEAVLLHGSDYPTRREASIFVSNVGGVQWNLSEPALSLANEKFDVVWCRRLAPPVLPRTMHPGDEQIARRECRAFNRGFWDLVAPTALWINPIAGRERAASKPLQISEAIQSGLTVPHTLFSNDPREIRKFISQNPGETIYKAFYPAQWKMEEGAALLFTNEIGLNDLPDDEMLRLSPGIFQKKIDKDHELRVTFMGDYACSAKLLSQQHSEAKLDWRAAGKEIEAIPSELPGEIYEACRRLMSKLGIVFGCFDFVVTPQGEHVFLEVNEMGQFLWLEEINPDLLLLEGFCQFLIQGGLDRSWRAAGQVAHFKNFAEDSSDESASEHLHEPTPDYVLVSD